MFNHLSKKTVFFVISNEPWGNQWFIKHHYAIELAKLGSDVYFVNPVSDWKPSSFIRQGIEVKKISENLKLVSYNNLLPIRVFPKLCLKINDWLNAKKLNKLRKNKRLIIWQFDAFRFSFNFFNNSRKIYHIADHYRDLPFDGENIKNSDLLVCTSKTFMEYYSSFGKETIYIPHAISESEFQTDDVKVADLKERYGSYILHAGSINDRLDIEIFQEILNQFDNHKLVLIGPNKLEDSRNKKIFEECIKRDNFVYLGAVDGSQVKNYVKVAKVCLVAYKFNSTQTLGPVTSSLKVLNYLAQKKPIITSNEIEYESLNGEAIYFGENLGNFIELIEKALNESIVVSGSKIDNFLKKHNYELYINKILSMLKNN